ncbi:MAG: hypothetical protein WBZ35_09750, partial [Pseudolabrys sp.]
RSHNRAGVGINAQGGGGVGETLTCPTSDGQRADARRDAERGFDRRDLAPGRRRLRGVPDVLSGPSAPAVALVNTGPYFDVAHEIAGLGGDHPDR